MKTVYYHFIKHMFPVQSNTDYTQFVTFWIRQQQIWAISIWILVTVEQKITVADNPWLKTSAGQEESVNKMVLPGNSMLLMSPVRATATVLIHLTGLLGSCHLSRPPTICTFLNPELQLCVSLNFSFLSPVQMETEKIETSLTSCHLVKSFAWKKHLRGVH